MYISIVERPILEATVTHVAQIASPLWIRMRFNHKSNLSKSKDSYKVIIFHSNFIIIMSNCYTNSSVNTWLLADPALPLVMSDTHFINTPGSRRANVGKTTIQYRARIEPRIFRMSVKRNWQYTTVLLQWILLCNVCLRNQEIDGFKSSPRGLVMRIRAVPKGTRSSTWFRTRDL